MFEKEAEEYEDNAEYIEIDNHGHKVYGWYEIEQAYQKGAEFGYNKAKEDVKHDLMMKLKDEGIVKLLKIGTYLNNEDVIAWKEIVLPEPSKYWDLSTGENNINKESEYGV